MKAVVRLLPVIGTHRRPFAEAVLWSTVQHDAVLALSLALAALVGRVMAGVEVSALEWAVGLGMLSALLAGAAWRESWVSHDLAYRLIRVLRARVFGALRRALPSRHRAQRTGDLVSALVADIETLEWLFAHTVAQSLSAALVLAVSIAVSLSIHPMLLLVWLPLLAVAVVVPLLTSGLARRHGEQLAAGGAAMRAELLDTIHGLRDLRAADALDTQLARLSVEERRLAGIRWREAARLGVERATADLALSGAVVGAIVIALAASRELPAQHVPLAVAVAVAGLGPASQILDLLRGAGTLRASAERVLAAIDLPSALPSRPVAVGGAGSASAAEQGLVFDGIRFAYPERPAVLDGLSLTVRPGETVALTGGSGAGKTTAARLALRLWDPDAGSIRVDGTDLRAMGEQPLRRLVSVVPQSSPLLRGTIRSNILLGDPAAAEADVRRAARAAGILSESAGLPRGLETPVGEQGGGLSGGQRARVAIARALLRRPRVLILDEATASLDAEADAAILDLLRQNRDHAVLLIAHRPATIAAADREVRLGR